MKLTSFEGTNKGVVMFLAFEEVKFLGKSSNKSFGFRKCQILHVLSFPVLIRYFPSCEMSTARIKSL